MMIHAQSAWAAPPYRLLEVRNVVSRMRRLATLAVTAVLAGAVLGCTPGGGGATPATGGSAPPAQESQSAPGGY
jgi:hypothetical protein